MIHHPFDDVTRALATGVPRRCIFKQLAAGMLSGGLLASLTRRGAAQEATPVGEGTTACLLPFEAEVRSGPDAELAVSGFLALQINADGAIDQGVLVGEDGQIATVVGQTTGRAVTLIFELEDGGLLFGTGGAQEDVVAMCAMVAEEGQLGALYAAPPLGGPFAGPAPGDIGDWITCCCPSEFNNFDCGRTPVCGTCPEPEEGATFTSQPCLDSCNAIDGGGVFGCEATCTLQS